MTSGPGGDKIRKNIRGMDDMNVFLNGGGCGQQTAAALKRFNGVIDHTKPLLYIPLAMEQERYPGCYEWIQDELREVDVPGIEMVASADELVKKDLNGYCAVFIGGGNTFKLLSELKTSGAFAQIKRFLARDSVVFGGSAGAIIFGQGLESCAQDDKNNVGLKDIAGFDVLNGISLLCHYTNSTQEKYRESTAYLTELSKRLTVIALPEEDTICINGGEVEVIGTRPYYCFRNGVRETREAVQ